MRSPYLIILRTSHHIYICWINCVPKSKWCVEYSWPFWKIMGLHFIKYYVINLWIIIWMNYDLGLGFPSPLWWHGSFISELYKLGTSSMSFAFILAPLLVGYEAISIVYFTFYCELVLRNFFVFDLFKLVCHLRFFVYLCANLVVASLFTFILYFHLYSGFCVALLLEINIFPIWCSA